MANSGHTPTPTHISQRSPDKGLTQSRQSSSRGLKIDDKFGVQQLTSYTQDSKISDKGFMRRQPLSEAVFEPSNTVSKTSYASLAAVVMLETMMMMVREIFADVIVHHLNPRPLKLKY